MTDLRGRLLRVLDRAVEYNLLTRDEGFTVLDAFDAAQSDNPTSPAGGEG